MQGIEDLNAPYCRTIDMSDCGATAFLVIDSFLGGGGTGGIRMGDGVTREEVSDLAYEMSLKFAWLNIPRGGAKAGICYAGDIGQEERAQMLTRFGGAISDLLESGEYVAGMDLGVGSAELAAIRAGAGITQTDNESNVDIDSNYYTALTVFTAMKELLLQRGKQLQGSTFLIEGAGKVGGHLMQLIDGGGGKITGVSTINGALVDSSGINVQKILALRVKYGDTCIEKYGEKPLLPSAELYWQKADVLIPGARTKSICGNDVALLQAKYVVSVANAAATPDAELAMYDAGIDYVPGFVSNSGGIFCWYLARLNVAARERLIRRGFGQKVRRLVSTADAKKVPIAALAREEAESKALEMLSESSGSVRGRVRRSARKLSPKRMPYSILRRLLHDKWAENDSLFCRMYFDSKYFS